MNYQLAPLPPSKIPRLQFLHSSRECKNQIPPSRSQLSNISISRRQGIERKVSNEELRQNIQTALQLLEEINIATKNTPSEWISSFEKDDTVLSAANNITDTKISPNLKEKKDMAAKEEFSKHQTLLASHSENFFPGFNYSPTHHKKENPFTRSLYSNSLSNLKRNMSNRGLKKNLRMTFQHLKKEESNEKFPKKATPIYHQKNISGLKNDESRSFFYELQSQLNKMNTKPTKSVSLPDQNMRNEQNQENISDLKTDESGRTPYELEKQWNEMIRTPVKLNYRVDQSMKGEQIKRFESSCIVPIVKVNNSRSRSLSYDMMRRENRDPRKERLNQKDVLSPFDHQVGSEYVTSRRRIQKSKESTSGFYMECPENKESGSTFQDLNLVSYLKKLLCFFFINAFQYTG